LGKYKIFSGVATATVTPFDEFGELDADAFGALVQRQIAGGAAAIVTSGTTGESATLTDSEKLTLLELAKQKARGLLPVIAGTGSNSTRHAQKLAREAELAGADGLLVVTPYYNKATARGLIEHYGAIAASTSLPIIVYTVPSRTGMGIPAEVWGELFAIPNVVGVKDATGDISHTARLLARYGGEAAVYAGCDDALLPTLALGGDGVISVVSNLIPSVVEHICRLFGEGKNAEAAALACEIQPLCDGLFSAVNPIPIKSALSRLGLCREVYRLPLCPLSEGESARLERLMKYVMESVGE
jgi:4-hydroxy-tetrahydrodipicolinate synthase